MEQSLTLRFVFSISFKVKVLLSSKSISDYIVVRPNVSPLYELYRHLERELELKCSSDTFSLLPVAVCRPTFYNTELIPPEDMSVCTHVPLVSDKLWKHVVSMYPYSVIKVVVEKRPSFDISPPLSCFPIFRKELKYLDVRHYFPEKLNRKNLVRLSELIFHHDCYVKSELRRGVWMHLLGVFHPGKETLEERETYIENLRRVYDTLKGKWSGDPATWSPQLHHLRECIQRDAIRTDPMETFLAGTTGNVVDDNVQKLIEIIMIYTLEHKAIKYTQGMTDLLSPILYVMEREDDAYICFSAMFERIKENFSEWCEGALNKLERLRHLCEVLDPELYYHLTENRSEDPFVLFFGMVLIECRREFSFQESLHLLEVLWSAALPKYPQFENISDGNWASYMTTESMDDVYQVFGERSVPYSAFPLDSNEDPGVSTRRSSRESYTVSEARQIPRPGSAIARSGSENQDEGKKKKSFIPGSPSSPPTLRQPQSHSHSSRDRSYSLPDSTYVIVDSNGVPATLPGTKSEGNLVGTDDDEVKDSVGELESSTLVRRINAFPPNTEMSDLSSLSSANTLGSNGAGLHASYDGSAYTSPAVPRKTSQTGLNGAKEDFVVSKSSSPSLDPKQHNDFEKSQETEAIFANDYDEDVNDEVVVNYCTNNGPTSGPIPPLNSLSTLPPSEVLVSKQSSLPSSVNTAQNYPNSLDKTEMLNNGCLATEDTKPHTLPRSKNNRPSQDDACTNTLPRSHADLPSSQTPSEFLRRLSNPSLSSPYVSSIRALDRVIPPTSEEPSQDPFSHTSSNPRLSPLPSFFEAMDRIANDPQSLEASIEVSHVMSQLASTEQARPNVNQESSLQIHMADAFSLFVCLAILIANREAIMEEQTDFVRISVLLNNQLGSVTLPHILKVARQLHKTYRHCQSIYNKPRMNKDVEIFETWLDDLRYIVMETPGTTPMSTPSSIRRASSLINRYDSATSCSVNY